MTDAKQTADTKRNVEAFDKIWNDQKYKYDVTTRRLCSECPNWQYCYNHNKYCKLFPTAFIFKEGTDDDRHDLIIGDMGPVEYALAFDCDDCSIRSDCACKINGAVDVCEAYKIASSIPCTSKLDLKHNAIKWSNCDKCTRIILISGFSLNDMKSKQNPDVSASVIRFRYKLKTIHKNWLRDNPEARCVIEIMAQRKYRNRYQERKKQREKEYNQRLGVKERERQRQKKYRQRPEVKERIRQRQKEYCQRPEVKERIRQYSKEHYRRPEVKERIRQYNKERYRRPEVKELIRQRQKEYYQRPEIKERIKQYYQRRKAQMGVSA